MIEVALPALVPVVWALLLRRQVSWLWSRLDAADAADQALRQRHDQLSQQLLEAREEAEHVAGERDLAAHLLAAREDADLDEHAGRRDVPPFLASCAHVRRHVARHGCCGGGGGSTTRSGGDAPSEATRGTPT